MKYIKLVGVGLIGVAWIWATLFFLNVSSTILFALGVIMALALIVFLAEKVSKLIIKLINKYKNESN